MSLKIKLWNRSYLFYSFYHFICSILFYGVFLIFAGAYKYHEETMERIEKINSIDIPTEARKLNEKIY